MGEDEVRSERVVLVDLVRECKSLLVDEYFDADIAHSAKLRAGGAECYLIAVVVGRHGEEADVSRSCGAERTMMGVRRTGC